MQISGGGGCVLPVISHCSCVYVCVESFMPTLRMTTTTAALVLCPIISPCAALKHTAISFCLLVLYYYYYCSATAALPFPPPNSRLYLSKLSLQTSGHENKDEGNPPLTSLVPVLLTCVSTFVHLILPRPPYPHFFYFGWDAECLVTPLTASALPWWMARWLWWWWWCLCNRFGPTTLAAAMQR